MITDPPFRGSPNSDLSSGPNAGRWEPESSGPGVGALFGVLRRKLWLIIATSSMALACAHYLVTRQVPYYQAEALVRLRDAGAALAGGVIGTTGQLGRLATDPISSEILVIRGRGVAGDLVERQGLRLMSADYWAPARFVQDASVTLPAAERGEIDLVFRRDSVSARFRGASARAAYGEPLVLEGIRFTVATRPEIPESTLVVASKDDAVDWILGSLMPRQRTGTDVIGVIFTSTDDELAVRMVNGIVDQYQMWSQRSAQTDARARRAFIDDELRQADSALIASQGALEAFRTREGVYRSDERVVAEQMAIVRTELELEEINDERRVFTALVAELQRPGSPAADRAIRTMLTTPYVARNPVVSALVAQFTQYGARRDSLLIARVPETSEPVAQLDLLTANVRARILEALGSHVKGLDARLAAVSERRARSAQQIRRLSPTGAEEVRLVQDVERARARADQFRQQKELARIAEAAALGNVEIVEHATRAVTSSRNAIRTLALGLAFGFFLGCSIAFLLEQMNTSIHRRSEIEQLLHVPGLAVIPQLPSPGRGLFGLWKKRDSATWKQKKKKGSSPIMPSSDALVTVTHSRDRSAEAYRALRTKLLFLRDRLPLRTLVITSATVGEGKTTTAANIATALAQQGVRVLLVDADLRRPRLHRLFGVARSPGLTDLLKNTAEAHEAIRHTAIEGLHLLPRGTPTSQPAELLGGDWMVAALRQLAREYDMVVIDTPPTLSASDAASLAGRADGVLFVLRAGRTHRAMAQEAMHQLESVGANVIGAVLNDPDAHVEKYEAYGYAYNYQYQP
jgi:tyrosine-protein kinase Etk/Wzc